MATCPAFVYVVKYRSLANEDDKYFVSRTTDLNGRLLYHFTGKPEIWSDSHVIDEVVHVHLERTSRDEGNSVREYMAKYGIDNVRGGPFNQLYLSEESKKVIQEEIDYSIATNLVSRQIYSSSTSSHSLKSSSRAVTGDRRSISLPSYPDREKSLEQEKSPNRTESKISILGSEERGSPAGGGANRVIVPSPAAISAYGVARPFQTALAAEGQSAVASMEQPLPVAIAVPLYDILARPKGTEDVSLATAAFSVPVPTTSNYLQDAPSSSSARRDNLEVPTKRRATDSNAAGGRRGQGVVCDRCGFDSHDVSKCFAKIHKDLMLSQILFPGCSCMLCGSMTHYTNYCPEWFH